MTQHANRCDNIQIRARTDQDLIDLKEAYPALHRSPIIETKDADYRWRLVVARWRWEIVGAAITADIDYGNFKSKMATIPSQQNKLPMLHDVWHLHHEYQSRRHPTDPLAGHPSLFSGDRADFFDDEPRRFKIPDNDPFWDDLEEPEPDDEQPEPEPVEPTPAKRRKKGGKR